MKHRVIFLDRLRLQKALLIVILVKLEVLTPLPVAPVVLLKKATAGEMHNPCDVLSDIA